MIRNLLLNFCLAGAITVTSAYEVGETYQFRGRAADFDPRFTILHIERATKLGDIYFLKVEGVQAINGSMAVTAIRWLPLTKHALDTSQPKRLRIGEKVIVEPIYLKIWQREAEQRGIKQLVIDRPLSSALTSIERMSKDEFAKIWPYGDP